MISILDIFTKCILEDICQILYFLVRWLITPTYRRRPALTPGKWDQPFRPDYDGETGTDYRWWGRSLLASVCRRGTCSAMYEWSDDVCGMTHLLRFLPHVLRSNYIVHRFCGMMCIGLYYVYPVHALHFPLPSDAWLKLIIHRVVARGRPSLRLLGLGDWLGLGDLRTSTRSPCGCLVSLHIGTTRFRWGIVNPTLPCEKNELLSFRF